MLKNKIVSFLACVIIIHVLLFLAGCFFIGLGASLVVSFLWACVWIVYCSSKESPLSAEDSEAGGSGEETVLPLAVAGGPWCWLLSPLSLIPQSHHKVSAPGLGWNMATKILRAFCKSALKIMSMVYGYCRDLYDRAGQDGGAGS